MQCKRKPVSASSQYYPNLSHCADLPPVSLVRMKSSAIYTRTAPDRGLINVASQKGANAYLRQMQKDGNPPFSSKLLFSINQYIHKPEESIEERFKLMKITDQSKDAEASKGILHGSYITMKSICTNASKDLLREVVTDTELRIIFNHFVSLLKYTISRENKGVIIDEACLHEAMLLIGKVLSSLNPSHDIIEDYLKSLAGAAKSATNALSHDSGVGYFLCHSLILCFTSIVTIKKKCDKSIMMMHKTGILEQVLRHIHLPWNTTLLNDLQDGFKNITRFFFITLASSSASLCSMFKAGSPSRDALVDVLEGRIKPCPENEHMMEILEALKKFLDMGLTSGNPDDQYISMQRYTCTKCKEVDQSRKLLVCGKCKLFGYCSRECQVADWKDHKQVCKRYASATKTKNLEAIAQKYMAENLSKVLEKSRKIYDGSDLVLDLDFSNRSSPALPPAYRNPPEFEMFQADIFWNREKDKAPDHWFFEDLGGGETFYSDEYIQNMREEIGSRNKHLNLVTIYIFMQFSDNPIISVISVPRDKLEAKSNAEWRKKNKSYQNKRKEYIDRNLKDLNISTSEKEEYAKKFNNDIGEPFGKIYDIQCDVLNKIVIGHRA